MVYVISSKNCQICNNYKVPGVMITSPYIVYSLSRCFYVLCHLQILIYCPVGMLSTKTNNTGLTFHNNVVCVRVFLCVYIIGQLLFCTSINFSKAASIGSQE